MISINKVINTDVVVVGGGIAGLCAAIAAAENGAKTLVLEKANSKRSGSGATGNDHFLCYYPAKHGNDISVILQELLDSLVGLCHDPKLSLVFLNRTLEVVQKWEQWGINMKPFGDDYEFMGHAYPGRPRIWLKYDGHNQKELLTRQAIKAGAQILNYHPAVDLIRDEAGIAGVLALDTSSPEPSFTLIKASRVILSTGTANRLYPAAGSPGWPFNTAFCPACTGAAQAQAWRIGATMVNMEFPNRHAGPKFFARAGKSTWIGLYRRPTGDLLGPFVDKATREVGDITYMDEKGIDPARHAVEFMQYEPHIIGRGLQIDEHAETSIPGLYAAGDMVGNFRGDIAGAAVYGWIAGEHAATHNQRDIAADMEQSPWVQERVAFYSQFMERDHGAHWKEANLALQQIMNDYAAAGPHRVRSASLLKAGLKYLADLRTYAEKELFATNSHLLMRTIEIFDLMDNACILMHSALERKESRGMHQRADFPFTNPLLANKFLMVRQENGHVITEWRQRWH